MNVDQLEFFKNYLQQLGGVGANARTILSAKQPVVFSVGSPCGNSVGPMLWVFVLYAVILYLIHIFV